MKTAIRLALALYPRSWRRRYEGEMHALLEDSGAGWQAVFDLVRGALAARMEVGMRRPSIETAAIWLGRNALGVGAFLVLAFALIRGGPWLFEMTQVGRAGEWHVPMIGRFMACALGAVICYKLRAFLVAAFLTWLAGFYGSWLLFTPVFGRVAVYERPIEPGRIAASIVAATLVWLVVRRIRARGLRVA